MAARKRARTSVFPGPFEQPLSITIGWRATSAELVSQAAAYLLRSSRSPSLVHNHHDVQLLLRLSSVCAAWRAAVYSSSVRHVDFWSSIGTIAVARCQSGTDFVIVDRRCPVNATPAALSSLRPFHSLVLDFGYRRSLRCPSTLPCCAPSPSSAPAWPHPTTRQRLNSDSPVLPLTSSQRYLSTFVALSRPPNAHSFSMPMSSCPPSSSESALEE